MTSLSINKFESYLEHKGFRIRKVFVLDNAFILIEILSMNSGEVIMLSIPAQYYFEDRPTPEKTFVCQPLSVKLTKELDDYLTVTENTIYTNYNNTNISGNLPRNTTLGMDTYLDDVYKKAIIVEDVKDNESLTAKTIHRQLHRLKYCIQGAQHKILIQSGPVFGFLDDAYKINLIKCERLNVTETARKIYIVVNLKHFYDKNDLIDHEVSQLYDGIYEILNNNQKVHLKNIHTIIANHTDLVNGASLSVHSSQMTQYIQQYTDLLKELLVYEIEKKNEFVQLGKIDGGNIQAEMKRNHQRNTAEKELKQMIKAKEDLIKNLMKLRQKYSTYTLEVDTILFDNIIMLDKIFKNFRLLARIRE